MSRGRTTILVVEDEPALRRIVLRILGSEGYQVVLAERAEDALARVELGQSIDLVISDFHLPNMDGLTFYRCLRDLGFSGRFLLTSGQAATALTPTQTLPPEIPFLQKPWSLADLTAAVRSALWES